MTTTLRWYTDAGLQNEKTDPQQVSQRQDGSTPPVQWRYWLGSTATSRKFQAEANPGNDLIQVIPTTRILAWQGPAQPYSQNNEVQPTTPSGSKFRAQNAGTSGAVEPVWPAGIGNTVLDNDIVWENVGLVHPITEMKVALTQGGLAAAVGGDPLDLATEILSGVANAWEVWFEVDTAINEVGTDIDIGADTTSVVELDA